MATKIPFLRHKLNPQAVTPQKHLLSLLLKSHSQDSSKPLKKYLAKSSQTLKMVLFISACQDSQHVAVCTTKKGGMGQHILVKWERIQILAPCSNWTRTELFLSDEKKKFLWDFQLISVGSRSDSELLCLCKSEPDLWIFGGAFTAEPRFSWMSKAREVFIFFKREEKRDKVGGVEGRGPFCCYNINSILHTAACALPCVVNKTGNIF